MTKRESFLKLRASGPYVLPSLLLCDFGNLEREVARLQAAGVPALHLDVMDGHFVPNFTYGMPIVAALRRLTQLPLDVHLMIERPENYLEAFVTAGADSVSVHIEAVSDPRAVLGQVRDLGAAAGIALNPATPLARLDGCLDLVDLVLVMSVPAGFGGQPFDPAALEKLRALRSRMGDGVLLEVDGGVNDATAAACGGAGADFLVVGSAIFHAEDYGHAIRDLRELARS